MDGATLLRRLLLRLLLQTPGLVSAVLGLLTGAHRCELRRARRGLLRVLGLGLLLRGEVHGVEQRHDLLVIQIAEVLRDRHAV